MTTTTFADLGVPTSLTSVLAEQGITTPTPIQAATLPNSLQGRDVLGRAERAPQPPDTPLHVRRLRELVAERDARRGAAELN